MVLNERCKIIKHFILTVYWYTHSVPEASASIGVCVGPGLGWISIYTVREETSHSTYSQVHDDGELQLNSNIYLLRAKKINNTVKSKS